MSKGNIGGMIDMAYVSNNSDDESPTVLIVDNNQMSLQRLSNLFKFKDFNIEVCQDGDKAVDEYIRLDPELVLLSLDIPSLDGHLAALEMREHGGEARIVFIAPKRLSSLAKDAALSAGAVACLEKPISAASLEEQWSTILGPIPEAPGLEDLDQLYPEDRIKVEPDDGPLLPLPELPGLPMPVPINADLSLELPVSLPPLGEAINQPKKKSRKLKLVLLILVASLAGVGYYAYSNNLF
ncbi:MAG: response regulator [Euryarchaeota archaeon TMED248]|nr:MAG: response regulator [Euryarchaeota archaeon TMED248]|tara:strand:+ start:26 stop:742 length:717 start_codon:yes stop_codon:yes gene_type:complete